MPGLILTKEDQSKFTSDPSINTVTRSHILNCSYDYWYPKYRSSTIKSKIINLPPSFTNYLRSDGIILSDDSHNVLPTNYSNDMSLFSVDDYNEEPNENCPSVAFPELHQKIKDTIEELGGLVGPKLNWSAPKDATWISIVKNSMECATPDDIYLLLKSSDFITHDLEHAFIDTVEDEGFRKEDINYVLVLRKWFQFNPSSEFRCFVHERNIIGICQRDLNYFEFLFGQQDVIRDAVQSFFQEILKDTFPDPDFVFDVYLTEPSKRVKLVDINPWAPRTDPLLFSWHELLSLPLTKISEQESESNSNYLLPPDISNKLEHHDASSSFSKPEIRLVRRSDPEAFNFSSAQYSAHKLPREVVHAGLAGEGGMAGFANQWEKMLSGDVEMQGCSSSDGEDNE